MIIEILIISLFVFLVSIQIIAWMQIIINSYYSWKARKNIFIHDLNRRMRKELEDNISKGYA